MQGGATGTGTVTVLAPPTSTNRTLTLPDQTGTVALTSDVLTTIAAATAGAVGTYAFLRHTTSADYAFGATLAGSSLQPAGIATNTFTVYTTASGASSIAAVNQATAQSGTWQCMGVGSNISVSCAAGTTASLWLRIS